MSGPGKGKIMQDIPTSKVKSKPRRLKLTKQKEVRDLDDSGVHLDEPLSPGKAWDAEGGYFFTSTAVQPHAHMSQSPTTTPSQLTADFQQKCSISTQMVHRISKSESPRPVYTNEPQNGRGADVRTASGEASGDRTSPKATFTFGSEDESDGEKPVKTAKSWRDQRNHDRSKARFKKILRPLRRSHSAGCSKDAPAHALFLRHQMERQSSRSERQSAGRGSMDRQSSDSDSDEDQQMYTERKSAGSSKFKPKSIAKGVKEKFAFLRRRHTDTSLAGKDAEGRPSPETVLTWSQDFDNLLLDKYGLELFREFLRTEFSEENIEFWIACEEYKNLKSNKLLARAQQIYDDYVAVQAPFEINLDSKTRLATETGFQSPTRNTFETAQKRIQALMEKDSYPRFLHSDVYLELLGNLRDKFNPT